VELISLSRQAESRAYFYESFAASFDEEMNQYEVTKRLRLVFDKALGDLHLTGRRLLDAGCGTGLFSQMAAERGAEVTSLDVGPNLLSEVAAKCDTNRIVGDTLDLPFEDESFDLVISTEVIEHTTDPHLALRELSRVLAPGGTLVVTTPNRIWHFAIQLANALGLRPYDGLENWVGWSDIRRWVEGEGLRVIDHRGFNAFPFVHPLTYPAVDRLDKLGRRRPGRVMINQLLKAEKAPSPTHAPQPGPAAARHNRAPENMRGHGQSRSSKSPSR
jgi:2-polyprenyl-3-methyl-5-hydroxy-6-metoxy-1,4-benzoquinol methylase